MEEKSLSSRIRWIDIAKGIGIILILLSHSEISGYMRWADGLLIPIFFFLSGYTFSKPKIGSKAISLLLPYLEYNLLIIVFVILTGFKQVDLLSIEGILYSRYALYPNVATSNIILLGIGNAPLWFLTAMFVSYCLFLPLIRASEKNAVILCVLYFVITLGFSYCPILMPWSIDCAFYYATLMYFGFTARRHGHICNGLSSLCLLTYALVMAINGHINLSIRDYGQYIILCLIACACGCVAITEFSKKISNIRYLGDLIEVVGKHSLSIFSLQLPLLYAIKKCVTIVVPDNRVVVSFIQVSFSCILGIAISKLLEIIHNTLKRKTETKALL